jgi:hypothetical protein
MEQTQVLILAGLLILISAVVGFYFMRERFTPDTENNRETYIKSSESEIQDPTILSNGLVQKYKDDDGKYIYNIYFNLPAIDSVFQTQDLDKKFNASREVVNYKVYATTDNGSVKNIGELTRQGNGEHSLETKLEENYVKFEVKLDDSLVGLVKL